MIEEFYDLMKQWREVNKLIEEEQINNEKIKNIKWKKLELIHSEEKLKNLREERDRIENILGKGINKG